MSKWLPRLGLRFRVTGSIPHAFLQPLQASPHAACLSAQAQSQLCSLSVTVTPWDRPVALVGIADRQRAAVWDKRAQDNLELALSIAGSHALLGKTSGHIAQLPSAQASQDGLSCSCRSSPVPLPPAQPQQLEPETGNNFHHGNPPYRITATADRDEQHGTGLCP